MAQDAKPTWNRFAASFRFKQTNDPSVNASTTFGQAYTGSNFAGDFHSILSNIDDVLRPHAANVPPLDGNDLMLGSLSQYPDDPQP